GGQVCPFLDSLSPFTLLGSLVTGYLISYCVRYLVFERWLQENLLPGKTSRRFQTECLLFSTAGATGAITVMFLLFNKDLDWLLTFGPDGLPFARKAISRPRRCAGLALGGPDAAGDRGNTDRIHPGSHIFQEEDPRCRLKK
ncbi:MAG: hypothetical protein ACRESZ_12750, partial [Methylococcales bacterium]